MVDQTRGDADRERRLLQGPSGQVVDGLLLSPWALSPAEVAGRRQGVPLVLLGERYDAGVDHVGVDNVAAARTATAHLLVSGRRRVAALGLQPHLANSTALQRVTGYRAALVAGGRPVDPALEVPVDRLHRADGARAMRSLLALPDPPDAVFCFTDELALGALAGRLGAGGAACPTTWRWSASTTSRTAAGRDRR